MKHISAKDVYYKQLNEKVRETEDKDIVIDDCLGQRYIGCALKDKTITVNGTPGNGLAFYLDGAHLIINGSAQDACGDTMNEGSVTIYGSAGDATGYAMRGGEIFIRDNVGYRAGIHMKAYKDKLPVLVIGGKAGSFLGEYQAGGIILLLGLGYEEEIPVGRFCGTGMHGGKIFLRTEHMPLDLPAQVSVSLANDSDLAIIKPYIDRYCDKFGADRDKIQASKFYVLMPNSKNPYKQLYVRN